MICSNVLPLLFCSESESDSDSEQELELSKLSDPRSLPSSLESSPGLKSKKNLSFSLWSFG